ncbi:MAG: hypothetical protein L0196_08310 [candidate division Zixibacteria bacterium]|nr:hypothetical protein [candidate division Zixibacteria bacterium]
MSKRLILLTIGVLLLAALSAWATESRVFTMGRSGLYLKDDAGIFFYPGTMPMYKNMIIAEHYTNSDTSVSSSVGPFSYGSFRRAGIILPVWNNGTLAVFAGDGSESFLVGGGGTFIAPNSRFLVGYGLNAGNATVGFQFDYSGVRDEDPDAVPQPFQADIFTANTWGFGVGLSTPMGDLNSLDLGFRLRIGSFEWKLDTTATDNILAASDGNTTLSFTVRDYYALNDFVNLVPVGVLGISTQKDVDSTTAPAERFKRSLTAIEVGLGIQTKPSENSEIIGGVGYRSGKLTEKQLTTAGGDSLEESTTETSLPFAFLGFEAQVKSWMHFRLGVNKDIVTIKNKNELPASTGAPDRDESKDSESPLHYAVGVGIHAGPVTMDASVSNDFFTEGPNFLSGQTSGDLFPRISFVYNFK